MKTTQTPLRPAAENPQEVSYMKTLAVCQPWASLIVAGIKDIECRNKMRTQCRKIFIAASGTKYHWDTLGPWVQNEYLKYQKMGVLPPYKELPTKAIIGYVDIVDVTFDEVDSPWGYGHDGIKYVLRNAKVLDEPIYGKNKATPYFYNVEGYDEDHLPAAHTALPAETPVSNTPEEPKEGIEFDYGILEGAEEDETFTTRVVLSPARMKELVKHIKNGDHSGLMKNLPFKVLEAFNNAVRDDVMSWEIEYTYSCYPENNWFCLPAYYPMDLVEQLPEKVREMLPLEKMREAYERAEKAKLEEDE